MKIKLKNYLLCLCLPLFLAACNQSESSIKAPVEDHKTSNSTQANINTVLIFSKTTGWRHDSIPVAVKTVSNLTKQLGLNAVITEDSNAFNDENLKTIAAIVFVNTTGDVLNEQQQIAMERYIQAGGGFVGIHSATDTEQAGNWYWYRRLIGGVFKSHPGDPSNVQTAKIRVVNNSHPATANLPEKFSITDEWYDFIDLSDRRHDLLTIDERSYQGGDNGAYHPLSWFHEFDGGRVFYTGIGHSIETYKNPIYLEHLTGGLRYALGEQKALDYSKSRPNPQRFSRRVVGDNFIEPVSFDLTADNSAAIITERNGKLIWLDIASNSQYTMAKFEVFGENEKSEFGLIALALAPDFANNGLIYLMYDIADQSGQHELIQRLSQFNVVDKTLDINSEKVLLDIPFDNTCCHTGGNLEFDNQGNLYIAIGDNTNPFESNDSGPMSNIADRKYHDALRTSANSQDLRGKILRITPDHQGGYSIPSGNLFTSKEQGQPEIYVMGTRNPYTIAIDNQTGHLYYGDIGPDGKEDTAEFGPRGYDEINKVTKAGNFGWPTILANNIPYRMYDYKNQKTGKLFNPLAPENFSPRNTGLKTLPPTQPALLWYPYARSSRFPELGQGGRNALVAGIYPAGDNLAYPSYYQGKLFISDFMRSWIKVVTVDEFDDVIKIEDLGSNLNIAGPLDLKITADGHLWVLEYGSQWWPNKANASLSIIEFTAGELPQAEELTPAEEGQVDDGLDHQARLLLAQGKQATKDNSCVACHTEHSESVGPAFVKIAEKYGKQDDAQAYIANTIAAGSSGKWGQHLMPAHNFLTLEERKKIANYILSIKKE